MNKTIIIKTVEEGWTVEVEGQLAETFHVWHEVISKLSNEFITKGKVNDL